MSSATITIESTDLQKFQEEVSQQFGPIGLQKTREAMGGAVRKELIEHFTALEQDTIHHRSSERLLAARTGFFAAAAAGVQAPQVEGENVSIAINKEGLAQRYFGGTISPKKGNWLTIPAIAQAYGKRAGAFHNLRFVYFRPDLAALVERLSTLVKKDRKGIFRPIASTLGAVFFWLKPSVTQQPDPSVLPTDDEMAARAIEAGNNALLAMWGRSVTP